MSLTQDIIILDEEKTHTELIYNVICYGLGIIFGLNMGRHLAHKLIPQHAIYEAQTAPYSADQDAMWQTPLTTSPYMLDDIMRQVKGEEFYNQIDPLINHSQENMAYILFKSPFIKQFTKS
jgi:hypothetical protein